MSIISGWQVSLRVQVPHNLIIIFCPETHAITVIPKTPVPTYWVHGPFGCIIWRRGVVRLARGSFVRGTSMLGFRTVGNASSYLEYRV